VPLIPMVLDGAEGMLGQLLKQLHLFPVFLNPPLHLVQQFLVHPTGDATTAFVAGALGPDRAMSAGDGSIVFDTPAFLLCLKAEREPLSCGAPVAILLWVIAEVFFAEEPKFAAGGGVGLGDQGEDAMLEAIPHLLAMIACPGSPG
jgi:hypothetical protein